MKPQPERKGPHPSILFGLVALAGASAIAIYGQRVDAWAIAFGVVGAALLIYGSRK
jgi:hypothetical protein